MKQIVLTILLLVMASLSLSAQEIKVLEIKPLEHSLKARTAQVRDNNGELCALLEVAAPKLEGLAFDETRHVGEVRYSDGVYSLFVPAGTKTIGFKHRDYMPGTIDFGAFGVTVESGMVYSVGLQRMDAAAEYQYLVLNVTPPSAVVELDGRVQQTSEGTVSSFVQVGTSHHYKVSAAGMVTEEGDVTVASAEQKTTVTVALQDNSSRVRIVGLDGAEIYVNDRSVGTGTWEGSLFPGIFKVEAKLGDQTVASEACTVAENASDVQTFVLTVFHGSLNITSSQPNVSVSLDGENLGLTPLLKSGILPGRHSVTARKQGFVEGTIAVTIDRDTVSEVYFDLIPVSESPQPQKAADVMPAPQPVSQPASQPSYKPTPQPGSQIVSPPSSRSTKSAKKKDFGFIGVSGGYAPGSGELSYGAMIGYTDQVGVYAKFRSNYNFENPSYSFESSYPVWKDKNFSATRLHATAGILFRAFGPVYPYVGAGYGARNVYAETVSAGLSLVSDHSYKGIAVEGGLLLRFGPVFCSVGFSTAAFKYGDLDFGVGISF